LKQLIINADDFGLSEEINRGIIQTYKQGVLTNASLMANMPAFENTVELCKQNPGLGIGVHLNIIRGKPILIKEKVKSLIDSQGYFYNFSQFIRKGIFSQLDLKQIEGEFRAQINKILDWGIKITHFDTEKHIHSLPWIAKILSGLADEFKINKIRAFRQRLFFIRTGSYRINNPSFYKMLFLAGSSMINQQYLKKTNLKTPDYFYILPSQGKGKLLKNCLMNIVIHLKNGVSEIVCHPGYSLGQDKLNSRELGKFNLSNREGQLRLLLSSELKQMLKSMNISLINYSQF